MARLVVDRAVGGDAVAAIAPLGIARVTDAVRVEGLAVGRVGPDLVIEGRVRYRRGRPPFASRHPAR